MSESEVEPQIDSETTTAESQSQSQNKEDDEPVVNVDLSENNTEQQPEEQQEQEQESTVVEIDMDDTQELKEDISMLEDDSSVEMTATVYLDFYKTLISLQSPYCFSFTRVNAAQKDPSKYLYPEDILGVSPATNEQIVAVKGDNGKTKQTVNIEYGFTIHACTKKRSLMQMLSGEEVNEDVNSRLSSDKQTDADVKPEEAVAGTKVERELRTFTFIGMEKEECEQWIKGMRSFIYNVPMSVVHRVIPTQYLVLINPVAGDGKAELVWEEVYPMFCQADVNTTVIITQYKNHAKDVCQEGDLEVFDGIVAVGGDGLVNEIVNGIMGRPDWQRVIKVPLAQIPAGNGNALSAAVGSFDPVSASYVAIKGRSCPIDLMTVKQEETTRFAILNTSWGMVSQVDNESEQYRWMGQLRYAFAAATKLMDLDQYSARIRFLPAEDPVKTACPVHDCSLCMTTGSRPMRHNMVGEQQDQDDEEEQVEATPLPECSLLKKFETSMVNEDWNHLESDEVSVFVGSLLPQLNREMRIAPYSHLSDGCVDMVVIRNVSRSDLLKMAIDFKSGEVVFNPSVEYYKVRAFQFEPKTQCAIKVDGEELPSQWGTFSCEVHRGLGRILCL